MADLNRRIKCENCEKFLLPLRFSENAKKKYFENEARRRFNSKVPQKSIRCLNCNAGNRQEMKCIMCDQVLSLDAFSKAQRRKTDDAHCINCQQEKTDREADHDKEVQEVIIVEEMKKEQAMAESTSYYSALASTSGRSRMSRAESERLETETNPASDSWAHGNDALSFDGSSDISTTVTGGRLTGTAWDGFDGDGRHRPARTVVSNRSNNSEWVKQNAVKKSVAEKAHQTIERERQRQALEEEQVERDDSDDDSEASEDPY